MGYTSGQEKFKDPVFSVTCECCAITQLKVKQNMQLILKKLGGLLDFKIKGVY